MFDVFEPLLRKNCGKLFIFAGLGFVTALHISVSIVISFFKFIA